MAAIAFSGMEQYICSAIRTCQDELLVICPFVKVRPLSRLLSELPSGIQVRLVMSWTAQNFLSGACDPEVFAYCREVGIDLRANSHIHLKVWLIDRRRLLLTSANITDSALGFTDQPNHEFIVDAPAECDELDALGEILQSSPTVDEEIYTATLSWLGATQQLPQEYPVLVPQPEETELSVGSLPLCASPKVLACEYLRAISRDLSEGAIHDLKVLGVPSGLDEKGFMSYARSAFLRLPIVKAVTAHLTGRPVYFGEMKECLQQLDSSSPKPSRQDLTPITQNLYRWLSELQPSHYSVDTPHYSERIQKIGDPPDG